MDQGSMRCDANVSLMPRGATTFGTRTETKNVNSIRFVMAVVEQEARRQVGVLEDGGRAGRALNSLVCSGAIISGGVVRGSVISPGVVVDSHALVEDSVLMHDVVVGEGAVVRRAILDKHVVVPPGARIGVDPVADARRFTMSPGGIAVVGKGGRISGP